MVPADPGCCDSNWISRIGLASLAVLDDSSVAVVAAKQQTTEWDNFSPSAN